MSRSFATNRADVRSLPPWHGLAYIARALPLAIENLAGDLNGGGTVLDYGCADVPYRRLFADGAEYLAADLPGNPRASVQIAADGTVPVADGSCDVVLSTQVLEHVDDPGVYLSECFRVLRPGGSLLLTTHGMMFWHPDPVDFWRWTCQGLRRAVGDAGFEVRRFEGVMGLAATGLQFFQDAILWKLPRRARPPVALVMQALIGLVDRFQGAESKRMNALVFGLVAEKPA
jgi:SAM-dependent methyltransferase